MDETNVTIKENDLLKYDGKEYTFKQLVNIYLSKFSKIK